MFEYYEKLFPPNLRYKAYENDNEHIGDRIKLLDMKIYDLLLDEKEKMAEEDDFINDFIMRYEEIKLLSQEKKERIRILEFLDEYIKDREEASQFAKRELTVIQIEKTFNMSQFLKTCLMMSLAYEINKKYRSIFAYINEDKAMNYPNAYIAIKLCSISNEVYNEIVPYMSELKNIKEYIFEDKNDMLFQEKNDIVQPLRLNEKFQKVLIKSENVRYKIPYYFDLFKYEDKLSELEFNQDIKENIVKISSEAEKYICYRIYEKAKIVFLKGPEGAGKRFYIRHALKELNRNVLFIDVSIFINQKEEMEELKKDILRMCLAENAIPCLNGLHKFYQLEKESSWMIYSLLMDIKNITDLIFITSEEEIYEMSYADYFDIIMIDIENPPLSIRKTYLENCMAEKGLTTDADIRVLLNKFSFTPGQIKQAVEHLKNISGINQSDDISEENVYETFNDLAFNKLSNLAKLIKPIYKWDDLVLKKEQKDILRQACNHIQYKNIVYEEWGFNKKRAYGNGVCVLFTGSPGTGKTMAAQVVAHALNINMYKVDLSQITSKYIGETEKNLKKLFDEAKKSNSLLFFDEADTIFGKRTEVKDSHDRHANMDAAYLLQKIEEYEGISILATNYIQNIDEAFIRRISFIIRFSMPEVSERKEIWQKSFPDTIPVERAIDFDFLASKFQLSGSNIKNIALHSAFLAASNNEGISMKHIINAIRTEYLKVNKILLKEDLGPYFEE